MSSRHSNQILHQMLPDIGFTDVDDERRPIIRNMHRGNEEAYFDVEITNENDAASIVESIKRYIVENTVQYEDITTEPPKVYKIDG